MAKISDIQAKADELQATLDAEQDQIATAMGRLNDAIFALQQQVTDGGTEAERQKVLDTLEAARADLASTVPDETAPPASSGPAA